MTPRGDYELLGDFIAEEVNRADVMGAGISDLFAQGGVVDSIANTAKGALYLQQQDAAQKQSAAAAQAAAQAAIAADAAATNANAAATVAAAVAKKSTALAQINPSLQLQAAADEAALTAAQQNAQQANAAQAAAGVGLTPDAVKQRVKAANDALSKANSDSVAAAQALAKAPTDAGKQIAAQQASAKAQAAQDTLTKVSMGGGGVPGQGGPGGGQAGGRGMGGKGQSGASFFSRQIGPLSGGGWLGLGAAIAAIATGVGLFLRSRRK